MTIYKTEVQMPDSGRSDWIIHLPLDENNPDNMSIIELSYSNELQVPIAMLLTEDANGLAYYDDMEYTLLRYDVETELQSGMFTVRPSLYPTLELTVLVEQKTDSIRIEVKRKAYHGDDTENDSDLRSEETVHDDPRA